jgi:hypothetical protein
MMRDLVGLRRAGTRLCPEYVLLYPTSSAIAVTVGRSIFVYLLVFCDAVLDAVLLHCDILLY